MPILRFSCIDLSIPDANLPGSQVCNLILMRHHDQCHSPLLLDPNQDLHDPRRIHAVQVSGRLIGQQDLRIVSQRPRNRHPLPLSRRELVGILPHALLQAHFLEQFPGSCGAIPPVAVQASAPAHSRWTAVWA